MAGRSRGEPPESSVDRDYPFQVAVLACEVQWRHEDIMYLSQKLGCYRLTRSLFVDHDHYVIYLFRERKAAECFLKAFDGEWITPAERKKRTWESRNVRMLVGHIDLNHG